MGREWGIDAVVPYTSEQPEHGQTSYSNIGYMVLGALIEETEGKPYQDAVKERVIDKLGLENTGYAAQLEDKENMVHAQWNGQDAAQLTAAGAAGSMFASAEDATTFVQEFSRGINGGEENQLFNEATLARMRDAVPEEGGFGLGFAGKKDNEGNVTEVGHGGQTTGYLTYVRHDVESGRSDIAMVAADNVSGMDMGQFGSIIEKHHASLENMAEQQHELAAVMEREGENPMKNVHEGGQEVEGETAPAPERGSGTSKLPGGR